ncbi:uncharacterized protein PAC_00952 [Phialocephala subalpina]|uniref:Uncharacterized protein n=1 Tax=Phialocephala subalpina TaxID=576137 RepID=A0A1L7WE69_9HELO|nr:uncharacterized protein PAC_00952 [Phialocephala subalpina]
MEHELHKDNHAEINTNDAHWRPTGGLLEASEFDFFLLDSVIVIGVLGFKGMSMICMGVFIAAAEQSEGRTICCAKDTNTQSMNPAHAIGIHQQENNLAMSRSLGISPIEHKVTRRFYEPLLLLHALSPIRGERIKPEIIPDDPGSNHIQLRRSFTNAIAYICAYEKGPDYVTAVALEKTPQGVVVWLGANADVEEEVVTFLEEILACVHRVVEKNSVEDLHQEASLATQRLASMIAEFQAPRLNAYRADIINSCIIPCQKLMTDYVRSNGSADGDRSALEVNNLQQWLKKYFGDDTGRSTGPSLFDLSKACYDIRHTQYLKTVSMFAGQGQTRHETFERLYKLLGKLGKPLKSSKTLTEAATKLVQDFSQGFTVKTVRSSVLKPLPFRGRKEATIECIVHRMFSDSSEETEFMNRLRSLGSWEGEEIDSFLKRERATKTRVHAELLLIDHFERNSCNFLGQGEKYIGCSKPACYLCHMYITQHPGRYTIPASHNKLYVGWRPPDVYVQESGTSGLLQVQEKILLQMIDLVRSDLSSEMRSRNMRLPYHTDSTTGITTTLESMLLGETDTPPAAYPDDLEQSTPNLPEPNEDVELMTSEDEDDEGGVPI